MIDAGMRLRRVGWLLAALIGSTPLWAVDDAPAAAEYQWAVEVPRAEPAAGGPAPTAFLWIPPRCSRVRGVVVGQNNMLERPLLEHAEFRDALATLDFAAIWITPMVGASFGPPEQRGFDGMLVALAAASGYEELATAAIVPIGHSALAEWPYRFAAARPDRTILAISLKGSWPDQANRSAGWSGGQVAGVPLLFVSGEYEWAEERAGKCRDFRRDFPAVPFSMLADAGGGHFDLHDPLVRFMADTITRAARRRLPRDDPPLGTLPKLAPIDATREGWLVDRWRMNQPARHPAATVVAYEGRREEAFWCFDEEHARATEAFQAAYSGKQPQLVGYLQQDAIVPQDPRTHQQVTLAWLPDPAGDGLTFTLRGGFLDTIPAGRPERWTGKKAGAALEHARGGGPVVIRPICGPIERRGPASFAVAFDRLGLRHPRKSGEIWLLAEHPGDDSFKRAVQQSLLRIPVRNCDGPAQTITFPEIPDQVAGEMAPIPLRATSNLGDTAPVRYYVHAGPAVLGDDGRSLVLEPPPPRSRFPVAVTVVAWQWGRSIQPLMQSAEPVARTFLVHQDANSLPKPQPRSQARPFAHPGLLHSAADLARIRAKIGAGASPWIEGFGQLEKHPASSADWKVRGPLVAARFAADDRGRSAVMTRDADAAYHNALMWCVTGRAKHARRAIKILDAWSDVLEQVDGPDARLRVALNSFKFLSAAELLRHTGAGWPDASVRRFEDCIRRVVLPQIRDFATYANGNWDAACLVAVMAAGVFLDDRELFDRAIGHFRTGSGNGRLTHYITPTGQCQESGRDQQHAQLGLGLLAEACEIAWQQGVDLYGDEENRLLKGFEYTARYNLGEDVPFEPMVDVTGQYRHESISDKGRGSLRPIYEQVWNHYEQRRGVPAPFTRRAAEKLRPEAGAQTGDHPGFGTLLFTQDTAAMAEERK